MNDTNIIINPTEKLKCLSEIYRTTEKMQQVIKQYCCLRKSVQRPTRNSDQKS